MKTDQFNSLTHANEFRTVFVCSLPESETTDAVTTGPTSGEEHRGAPETVG